MHISRQKLLSQLGELLFVDEPSGESGKDKPTDGDKDKSTDGDEDKSTEGDEDKPTEEDEDSDDEKDGDFKPITSKEEFERILGKRLHRERAKYADYQDLKQKVKDQEATIADLNGKLGEHTLQQQRKSIADSAGVPENLLRGTTEDELKAHAEELKAAFATTEEDERIAARRAARSPHTGTGAERPPAPSLEQGREAAQAYLKKTNRKDRS